NAGLDQNPVTSSIIFREGAPSRDPQVLIIALGSFVVDVCEWLLVHWSFISCDHRAERMPTM
ncbi:hypothetical protein, partial [Nocardia farcinica]